MLHRDRRLQAFTLVELLVVIGIIALLMSILLPALNRARESANQVKCQSNLKQIALAVLMYEQSQKGLPGPSLRAILDPEIFEKVTPALSDTMQPGTQFPLDLTQWSNNPTFMKYMGASTPKEQGTGVNKIYAKSGLWTCPSNMMLRNEATIFAGDSTNPSVTSLNNYRRSPLGFSYRINNVSYSRAPHFFGYWFLDPGETAGASESNRPKKLSEVRAPGYGTYPTQARYISSGANIKSHAAIWMLADIDGRNFSSAQSRNFGITHGNQSQVTRRWQPVHRKNNLLARNYAFFDGHTETLSLGEGPAGMPGPRDDNDKGQLSLIKITR